MIHDSFHEIEEAPADEHPSRKGASADRPAPIGCAPPEHVDTDGDGDPRRGVKEAVPERVGLKSGDRRLRIAALAGQHVVPLKDLVQDDAVHEPAEADPEQDAGSTWASGGPQRVAAAICRSCSHRR